MHTIPPRLVTLLTLHRYVLNSFLTLRIKTTKRAIVTLECAPSSADSRIDELRSFENFTDVSRDHALPETLETEARQTDPECTRTALNGRAAGVLNGVKSGFSISKTRNIWYIMLLIIARQNFYSIIWEWFGSRDCYAQIIVECSCYMVKFTRAQFPSISVLFSLLHLLTAAVVALREQLMVCVYVFALMFKPPSLVECQ